MKYTSITENHLFRKAYVKGKKYTGKLIAVYVLKDYTAHRRMLANPQKKYINRLGISVSKKVGGAVTRSRIRRIIREGYWKASRREDTVKGQLIVIGARSASATAKSTDIAAELEVAFEKLGMYKIKTEL